MTVYRSQQKIQKHSLTSSPQTFLTSLHCMACLPGCLPSKFKSFSSAWTISFTQLSKIAIQLLLFCSKNTFSASVSGSSSCSCLIKPAFSLFSSCPLCTHELIFDLNKVADWKIMDFSWNPTWSQEMYYRHCHNGNLITKVQTLCKTKNCFLTQLTKRKTTFISKDGEGKKRKQR